MAVAEITEGAKLVLEDGRAVIVKALADIAVAPSTVPLQWAWFQVANARGEEPDTAAMPVELLVEKVASSQDALSEQELAALPRSEGDGFDPSTAETVAAGAAIMHQVDTALRLASHMGDIQRRLGHFAGIGEVVLSTSPQGSTLKEIAERQRNIEKVEGNLTGLNADLVKHTRDMGALMDGIRRGCEAVDAGRTRVRVAQPAPKE